MAAIYPRFTAGFIVLILLIFTDLISHSRSLKNNRCSDRSCYPFIDYFEVRFPFRLDKDDPSCGYSPSFTLSCTTNETHLHLPNGTSTPIESISFSQQIVSIKRVPCFEQQLYDSSFSLLSGSPFVFNQTDSYTYYNCTPSEYLTLYRVKCMSQEDYWVIVMQASFEPPPGHNCSVMKTLIGPVGTYGLFDGVKLRWDEPNCLACEAQLGDCRFESHSSSEIVCHVSRGHGLSDNIKRLSMWLMLLSCCLEFLMLLVS